MKFEGVWSSLSRKGAWVVYAFLFGTVTLMWWPTLFGGKAIIFGDSVIHGLSLLHFLKNFLHGGESPLWIKEVYGGHPLFAEAQGGFASPLNLFVAWAFPPALASSVFHYLCLLLGGAGVVRLCRTLGATIWSAGFAAFAVIFSGSWISAQNNLTISGALIWVPWTLVVFESWLRKPSMVRAIWVAIVGSLSILAGYPQSIHGVVIFALCTLLTIPFSQDGRAHMKQHWQSFLGTGFLTVVLCFGLSAFQLLPLLELIGLSHRGGGVVFAFQAAAANYLRGMLFPLAVPDQVPGAASLLVCMLASSFLMIRSQWRIKGYLIASCVLILLGMGGSSPMFRWIYEAHLIPGLHYFRIMWIYLSIAIVGMGVLAAFAIDALTAWLSLHVDPLKWKLPVWLAGLVFFALWFALAAFANAGSGAWLAELVVVIALLTSMGLAIGNRAHCIPAAMFMLLALQCTFFSTDELKFYDAGTLTPPSALDKLPHGNTQEGGKLLGDSIAISYAFLDSATPGLKKMAQRAVASDAGMTNLLRGDSSLDGATALELYNRDILSEPMANEVNGTASSTPGFRAIDVLNVRYIISDSELHAPGLYVAAHDQLGFWVMKNTFVRPFVQVYADAFEVSSADTALAALRNLRFPTLVVQADPGGASVPKNFSGPADVAKVIVTTAENRFNHYIIDVQSPFACWIFLADANYPGWRATVDGAKATVWTAQVLGKAVHVPAGSHQVVVGFRSDSFRLGVKISALSLLVMLGFLAANWIRQRRE